MKEDRSMGGVCIMEPPDWDGTFYLEGISKVKKGDVFFVVEPGYPEGYMSTLRRAEEDAREVETILRDGTRVSSWHVKTDPNFQSNF